MENNHNLKQKVIEMEEDLTREQIVSARDKYAEENKMKLRRVVMQIDLVERDSRRNKMFEIDGPGATMLGHDLIGTANMILDVAREKRALHSHDKIEKSDIEEAETALGLRNTIFHTFDAFGGRLYGLEYLVDDPDVPKKYRKDSHQKIGTQE